MQNFGMTFAPIFSPPTGNSSARPIPTPSFTCSLGIFSGLAGTYVSVLFTLPPLNRVWNPAKLCQHLSLPTQVLRWHSEFSPERCWRNFQERICATVNEGRSGSVDNSSVTMTMNAPVFEWLKQQQAQQWEQQWEQQCQLGWGHGSNV